MWAVFVVIDQPLIRDRLNLFDVCKQMGIQDFRPLGAVEPFDKSILVRLARLDITDRNTFTGGPFCERARQHFRAVIQAYGIGGAVVVNKASQNTDQAGRGYGSSDLDGQTFPVGFVDDVERPEPSPTVQSVMHKVQGPAAIGLCGQVQWLTRSVWQAGASWYAEASSNPCRNTPDEHVSYSSNGHQA